MARYLEAVRPGSGQLVLELDADLVDIAREELGLADAGPIDIRTGDARLHLDDLPPERYDLVIGDAFAGLSVPWHLTTIEVMRELQRTMRPGGVYAMNVIDGGGNGYARAQVATLAEVFAHVTVIEPAGGLGEASANQILVASDAPIVEPTIGGGDGRLMATTELAEFVGDARVLTDDFAPADQLLG